jgi:hypothetical protein
VKFPINFGITNSLGALFQPPRLVAGWFLALRGLVLLAAPQLYASGGAAAMNMMPIVQIWFAFLVLIGLWLTFVG